MAQQSWRSNRADQSGTLPLSGNKGNYNYYNELNSESYLVENPDALEPADENAFTIFRYAENNLSAGVLYKSEEYSTSILGFPIESVKKQEKRNELIKNIMKVFE